MPREHALHTHDEAAATRAKSEIAAHPTTGCSGGGGSGGGGLAIDVEADWDRGVAFRDRRSYFETDDRNMMDMIYNGLEVCTAGRTLTLNDSKREKNDNNRVSVLPVVL